jgi:transposase InsO family protein
VINYPSHIINLLGEIVMSKPVHPIALFRLSVLGPLTSRLDIERGEIKRCIKQLSTQTYSIPNSKRVYISAKTIQRWYYCWLKHGIDGLSPKTRSDKGTCGIPATIQDNVLSLKQEQPSRSIPTIITMLEHNGVVARKSLARSSVHRFLKKKSLSARSKTVTENIERRAFEAQHAGDIWYGDVMHGPMLQTAKGGIKTYLVTIFDDASRLVCHSKFCLSEKAIVIEHVLKEALLKRGLPHKLIVDNGPAYRAETLQAICARLKIHLIYGRPYEPQSKGKLERWHRTVREKFLAECRLDLIDSLEAFNARLWIWLETVYHNTPQTGLPEKLTPSQRYQQDLEIIKPLGHFADKLDDYFYHRVQRRVKKDGTVSVDGKLYEVPYQLAQQTIVMVIDPYTNDATHVESLDFEKLGDVSRLDKQENLTRKRARPQAQSCITTKNKSSFIEDLYESAKDKFNITEEND